jgi:T5SS/PEP-CTERM-associated repeat protein
MAIFPIQPIGLEKATPTNTDTAIINNGTTATLTGTSSVANLDTGVGYSNASGAAVVSGGDLSASGTVATGVDGTGSKLNGTGDTIVGDGGNGALNITNGGTVSDTNGTLGNQPGSSGTAIVDGNGSQWNNSGSLDELGHDSAVVDAGVSVDWTKTISTYVSYDGSFRSNDLLDGLCCFLTNPGYVN